jgi:hypothetical protein
VGGLKPGRVTKPKAPKATTGTVVATNLSTNAQYTFNLNSTKTSIDVPFVLPYSISVPAGTYDVTCTISGDSDILEFLCSSPPNPQTISSVGVVCGGTPEADFQFDASCNLG